MNEAEIKAGVSRIKWWGSISLPGGIVTPGERPANAWQFYNLPERLDGLTVLDVGAHDGYFSFEAERRGASRVVAIDLWNHGEDNGWEGFSFAKQALTSCVESYPISIYDIDFPPFDVVLCIQVLYHLQHPLLAMQKLSKLCKQWTALETVMDAEALAWPAMIFYPRGELRGDTTNWWGFNHACIIEMASVSGFKTVDIVKEEGDSMYQRQKRRVCFMLKK